MLEKGLSFLGIFVMLGCAYLMSMDRKAIKWRPVIWGVSLQLIFAVLILYLPFGKYVFDQFDVLIKKLLSFADEGAKFLFASFISGNMDPPVINFAFAVLPTIIFFSAFMTLLYHTGIMNFVVSKIAIVMQKTMKTSGAETLSAASNIFVGQTEAPLVVKPFVKKMTQSELMAVMTGGFATVAGGVMALYVKMLDGSIEGIAGHLLAASVMSAPAALAIAKIMIPETKTPETADIKDVVIEKLDDNAVEAASRGATEGMTLALNVAGMLVAFVSLVAMANWFLSLAGLSLQEILGYIFFPFAVAMGIPFSEALQAGTLLGEKIVLTELIAYKNLAGAMAENQLSQRTGVILSYALCGFANFASIGIQIGGIGSIAPERRKDLAKIAFRAMWAGVLAANMTATIAGILI